MYVFSWSFVLAAQQRAAFAMDTLKKLQVTGEYVASLAWVSILSMLQLLQSVFCRPFTCLFIAVWLHIIDAVIEDQTKAIIQMANHIVRK